AGDSPDPPLAADSRTPLPCGAPGTRGRDSHRPAAARAGLMAAGPCQRAPRREVTDRWSREGGRRPLWKLGGLPPPTLPRSRERPGPARRRVGPGANVVRVPGRADPDGRTAPGVPRSVPRFGSPPEELERLVPPQMRGSDDVVATHRGVDHLHHDVGIAPAERIG